MKLNKIIVAMGTAVALCTGAAYARDASTSTITVTGGTIHFTGDLVAAPCAVSTDSSNQTVPLGEYTTHHFNAPNIKGTLKPFQIKLEDCDTSTYTTAAVQFQGRSTNANLLAIDSGLSGDQSATATNVGIQILDSTSKVLVPNGDFSTAQTLNDGENILNFAAQYVSTGVATAGDANADATFIMQYN